MLVAPLRAIYARNREPVTIVGFVSHGNGDETRAVYVSKDGDLSEDRLSWFDGIVVATDHELQDYLTARRALQGNEQR